MIALLSRRQNRPKPLAIPFRRRYHEHVLSPVQRLKALNTMGSIVQ
jgi:hypothetical protein